MITESDKNMGVYSSRTKPQSHEIPGNRPPAIDRSTWKRVRLGEVGDTYGGLTGKSASDFGKGNASYIPFLNVLNNTAIDIDNLELVSVSQNEHQNHVRLHDLFFNTSSETPEEVGTCAFLECEVENVFLNSFCFGFRLKENCDIHPRFLAEMFNSMLGRTLMSRLAQGATRYNLSKEQFLNLTISLPSFDEQRRIASALSLVDKHISSLQSLITKYEAIKKATVNLLLKPKEGWHKIKTKDFCPLQRGFDLPKRLRKEGKYPLVCSNGIAERIDTALQKAPGVVTGRSGTIGAVHFLTEDYWPHNTTLWVTKFIDADPMFVYHLLSNMNLLSFSGGSGIPTLNRNRIHETIISVPTIHKQREIALQISAIDNALNDGRAQLAKAQSIKQSMMSYFFG